MATPNEIMELLKLVREHYGQDNKGQPRFSLTERSAALWVKLLVDLPYDAICAALEQHLATNNWPPTIADLRQGAQAVTAPELPSYGEAWGEVMDQLVSVGNWREPSWSHPLIGQAVHAMGGWQTMCAMEVNETATWRAQFRDIYNALVHRAEADARLLPEVRALADRKRAELKALDVPKSTMPDPAEGANPPPTLTIIYGGAKPMPGHPIYGDREGYLRRVALAKLDPDGPEAKQAKAEADKMRRAAEASRGAKGGQR